MQDMNESPQPPLNPPQPPVEPPVQPSPQPPIPPAPQPGAPGIPPQPGTPGQAPQGQTDILGIIGIVLAIIGFAPIGLILGLIGASKAKREQRSPLLSRIAWILSLVITVLFTLGFILLVTFGLLAASQNKNNTSTNTSDTSSSSDTSTPGLSERKDYGDGFSLIVPDTFTDIPNTTGDDASYAKGDDTTAEYVLIAKQSTLDVATGMTAQEYGQRINEQFQLTNPVATSIFDIENPAGYDVADFELRGSTENGTNLVYYIRYIKTATYFYQVVTWTAPSQAAQVRPDLVKIIESFREV
jgi:hypothetical protein